MKVKLSDRIRPNSEVLPWIYEEIKLLENQLDEEHLICDTQSSMLEYQAKRNADLVTQIETMREAIKEAHEALEDADGSTYHIVGDARLTESAKRQRKTAIVKLQSLLNK